jgi:hypothetical protein
MASMTTAATTAYVAVLELPGPRLIHSRMCGTREHAEQYLAWLRRRQEESGARVLKAAVEERRLGADSN